MQSGSNKNIHSVNHKMDSIRFRKALFFTLIFVCLLWFIKIIEISFEQDFGILGIYPRTLKGMVGIFTSPFIHNDIYHLISNSFPLLLLGVGVLYFYQEISHFLIAFIYLLSGFWVWLTGREAYHIGASGIVYGLLFFLLVSGFIKRDRRQLAISFVILVLYGGSMFAGMFPSPLISYEAHITGAIAGVIMAVYFRKHNYFFHLNPEPAQEPESGSDREESDSMNHTGDPYLKFRIAYKNEKDHQSKNE